MAPRRVLALLALLALATPFTDAQVPSALPFRDPALPLEKRVDDLVGRLTLDEKVHAVRFSLDERAFSFVRADGRRVVEPGRFTIAVGGKHPGLPGTASAPTTTVLSADVGLVGATKTLAP